MVSYQRESSTTLRKVDYNKVLRLVLRMIPFPFFAGPDLYDILTNLQLSRTEVGAKVGRAVKALTEASELVTELQNELSERVEKVSRLKSEYEKYELLAKVEESKARALIAQIEDTVGRGRSRERWIALVINLIAGIIVFMLGIFVGPRITAWLGISPQV